jgi:DNA polymerase-3 subunit gamma/tau
MAYTVLARKYRSQTFDEVVGQDALSQTLKNAIKTGRVAHAYLFTGTRGVGKTTMARILAKSLNCLSADAPTTKPCCKCESCTAINVGEDIDVIEIDGATNNGVDQVRQLRENTIYRPARARYKIYIIDEVHMLTVPAFNALLKTLEEPPPHVKFIFATTEPTKVIATIQSRCQRFDFTNIGPKLIADQLKHILKEEGIKYEEDLILPLAKMANGSMRDGISLLDRLISTGSEPLTAKLLEEFLGCPNSQKLYNLIEQIGKSDAAGTLEAVDKLINDGMGEVQIIDALIDYMRDLMVVKSAGADSELLVLTAEQRKRCSELAVKFDVAGLVYNITTLERLRWSVKNTDSPRALLEAALLRFALSEHFLNVETLLSRSNSQTHDIKKNAPISSAAATAKEPAAEPAHQKAQSLQLDNLQAVKENWRFLLEAVSAKAGNSTAGLLGMAEPTGLENGVLTVTFPSSAQVQKKMCENNERTRQIEAALAEHFNKDLKVKFEIAAGQTAVEDTSEKKEKTGRKKNELINDPAVKTVLMGLDATITGIEENTQQ